MPTLYFIGLGLSDERDISVKGLEIVRKSTRVFLESYTSLLNIDHARLEAFYQKKVEICYRETVEIEMDEILKTIANEGKNDEIFSFLVIGDPFCATTHSDLQLRAIKQGIKVKAIHNASIINAVGVTGMQLYSFGHIVSVPFFTEKWKPYSFLNRVVDNYKTKLHTLVLLDIRVREISDENLLKGKKIYDPPHFMSVNVCLDQIVESVKANEVKEFGEIDKLKVFGVARIGADDQLILSGTIDELRKVDFGKPLHSVIVCGPEMHELEKDMFNFYNVKNNEWKELPAPKEEEEEEWSN
jgi:diphthine synthase